MAIFDYIETDVKAKLTADGFEVNDSMQDVEGYRQGPYLVFVSSPDVPEVKEDDYSCAVVHYVNFNIDIFAYDYNGTSNIENISEVYEGVVQSLWLLRNADTQDLTLQSALTNINFVDQVEIICQLLL